MDIRDFLNETTRGAGEIIMQRYGRIKTRQAKGDRGDFATEADLESESYIINRIREVFPDHGIVSEEAGSIGRTDSGYVWLIDPLDGTRNYASGIPLFCISMALVKDGIAEYGAVYDPVHNELFFAAAGHGATINGEPMHVSNEPDLEDGIISISWLRRRADRMEFIGYVERIAQKTSYFRRFGSAALTAAYAAAGRVDVYMQGGISNWDIAAGTLLVSEAGGSATDFEGRPIDLRHVETNILAANPILHKWVLTEIIGVKSDK